MMRYPKDTIDRSLACSVEHLQPVTTIVTKSSFSGPLHCLKLRMLDDSSQDVFSAVAFLRAPEISPCGEIQTELALVLSKTCVEHERNVLEYTCVDQCNEVSSTPLTILPNLAHVECPLVLQSSSRLKIPPSLKSQHFPSDLNTDFINNITLGVVTKNKMIATYHLRQIEKQALSPVLLSAISVNLLKEFLLTPKEGFSLITNR